MEGSWFQDFLDRIRTNSLESARFVGRAFEEGDVRRLAEALQGNVSVRELDLSRSGIGASGAEALAVVLASASIQKLSLGQNQVQDPGAVALAAALRTSSLRELHLDGNEIGDEGAKALAAALQDAPLALLDLSRNRGITSEGATALATALRHSNIEELRLALCSIGHEGCQAFLEGARDTAVRRLDLTGTVFSMETALQLDQVLNANKARAFLLQMQVEGDKRPDKTEWTFTFRTVAGAVAAVSPWSSERGREDLPEAIFDAMRSSGFQLPDRHLRPHNLRIVRPDGQLLDDADLAAQLRDPTRT